MLWLLKQLFLQIIFGGETKMKCNQCGDTGKEPTGKYCRCIEGRTLKRIDQAAQRAFDETAEKLRQEVAENSKKAVAMHQDTYTKKERIIEHEIGDWVYISNYDDSLNGVLGEVIALDLSRVAVKVRLCGQNSEGNKPKGRPWIYAKYLKTAPVRLSKKERAEMNDLFINLALDTKDYEWLKELGGKK